MDHLILNNGSDSAALAEVALKALREARNSKTSSSGSIFVSDGQTDDDGIALGTGTIINGVDGGIQPWVGDTTPPGKPTGITAESHNGSIWVSWDGTLEGGVPADFDHVQFTAADGSQTVDMGQLRAAGKVTAAELTAGNTAVVTAVAFDDAHDENGNSTPNASPISDAVTVIVQSAVDAGEVEKAQDDAQTALNQAGQAVDTATASKQESEGAKADAANAVTTANSAKSTASTAKSTADNASSVATQANATAVSANQSATSAQTAANLALQNAQELVRNPTMQSDVGNPDGWPSNVTLGASGAPFDPPTPFTTYAKVTGRDHNASWTLTNIPGRVIQYTIYAVADSTANQGLQFGAQYSDSNGNWKWYAALVVSVEKGKAGWAKYVGTFTVPENISSDPNWPRPWLQINGGAGDSGWYVTGLSIKDITEAQAAQKAADDAQSTADNAQVAADNAKALANAAKAAAQGAQTTADGKNKIFSSASEPSHTGIVPGDMWFQLDSNKNVTGIKVWNGSVFVDYVLMANQILVAGSVGTIQLANGAVTADQITASEALLKKLLVRNVSADEIDVGGLAAAIVTSGLFQTASSGARVVMDSNGISAYDSANALTFQIDAANGDVTSNGGTFTGSTFQSSTAADTGIKINSTALQMWDSAHNKTVYLDGEGKNNVLTGNFQTSATGNRVSINSQSTSTLTDGSATLSGQLINFEDNDFAASPQIGGYFTHSDLGDAPRLSLLSGWKTDHDPASTIYLQSWPRSKGATGTGITSRAVMSAITDYTEPDLTKKSYATLELDGIGGSGAYASLEAHASGGSQSETWVTATRNDGVTHVGIGADAFTQTIYFGGKLGGINNQRTFQAHNWRAYTGTTASGVTLSAVTVTLSPAKYGVYRAVANADCNCGSISIHVTSTGNASTYKVIGYNAGSSFTGSIWVCAIAWLV